MHVVSANAVRGHPKINTKNYHMKYSQFTVNRINIYKSDPVYINQADI